ncbi:hypothetical protein OG21DRAFT_1484126 [Imleria badia]|nr:hypothetical protein OG21DRAFT_1484126 [Imleria badia]
MPNSVGHMRDYDRANLLQLVQIKLHLRLLDFKSGLESLAVTSRCNIWLPPPYHDPEDRNDGHIYLILSATFDIINSDQVVFIHFLAEWCGPCRAIKLQAINMNAIGQEVRITNVPSSSFKDGIPLGTIVGAKREPLFVRLSLVDVVILDV